MKNKKNFEEISEKLALHGLRIGAIKIRPNNPFLWASGTYNPIYNDNRLFLFYPEIRRLVIHGFLQILTNNFDLTYFNVIAGISTSGIPHGYGVAESLDLPFIYIRDKPKGHGLRNQIEGIGDDEDLAGKRVLLIEDLISTGGSSVNAVSAIRNANGICEHCFSIFNYELPDSEKMFKGELSYNKDGDTLSKPCHVTSLLSYSELLKVGIDNNFIEAENEKMLKDWIRDQKNWGLNNGFI